MCNLIIFQQNPVINKSIISAKWHKYDKRIMRKLINMLLYAYALQHFKKSIKDYKFGIVI